MGKSGHKEAKVKIKGGFLSGGWLRRMGTQGRRGRLWNRSSPSRIRPVGVKRDSRTPFTLISLSCCQTLSLREQLSGAGRGLEEPRQDGDGQVRGGRLSSPFALHWPPCLWSYSARDFVMVPLMFGMILTDSRPSESLRLLLTFDL